MNKPIIKIMADYQCFPLWKIYDEGVENINPRDLSVTQKLRDLLIEWQNKYDSTLNSSNPIASGFETEAEEIEFDEAGRSIWKQMLTELGDSYNIKYYSVKENKLYDSTTTQIGE